MFKGNLVYSKGLTKIYASDHFNGLAYRHLPGISSVRMDTQTFGDIEAVANAADSKNSSILEG